LFPHSTFIHSISDSFIHHCLHVIRWNVDPDTFIRHTFLRFTISFSSIPIHLLLFHSSGPTVLLISIYHSTSVHSFVVTFYLHSTIHHFISISMHSTFLFRSFHISLSLPFIFHSFDFIRFSVFIHFLRFGILLHFISCSYCRYIFTICLFTITYLISYLSFCSHFTYFILGPRFHILFC